MQFLYNIFISLMIFGMKIGAFFNSKLKKGVEGRKKSAKIVAKNLSPKDCVIWMHAASLGEYEQGLPVLENWKKKFPDYKILITFFSPSGYENVVKRNHIADAVCYLPFDKPSLIKAFIKYFDPQIFFTVKYDYWYHLLRFLKQRQTKVYVISSLFYEGQVFFRPYGKWFSQQLRENVDWFFHQNQNSCDLAQSIGLNNSSVAGDTRFDRVKEIRQRDNSVEFIRGFIGDKKLIVFGSSWEKEEQIALQITTQNNNVKIVIAPHDLKRVEHLQKLFPKAILFSEFTTCNIQNSISNILIIDCIGLLSKIYSYAYLAVVGGGFHNRGLHNVLEAATFGIPVFFGNHYRKNPEADYLIKVNGAQSFSNENETSEFILNLLNHQEVVKEMGNNAKRFIDEQPNSSEIILKKMISDISL